MKLVMLTPPLSLDRGSSTDRVSSFRRAPTGPRRCKWPDRVSRHWILWRRAGTCSWRIRGRRKAHAKWADGCITSNPAPAGGFRPRGIDDKSAPDMSDNLATGLDAAMMVGVRRGQRSAAVVRATMHTKEKEAEKASDGGRSRTRRSKPGQDTTPSSALFNTIAPPTNKPNSRPQTQEKLRVALPTTSPSRTSALLPWPTQILPGRNYPTSTTNCASATCPSMTSNTSRIPGQNRRRLIGW